MVTFKKTIEKFEKKGEKTGWTYITIDASYAKKLSDAKIGFRIKGKLDDWSFSGASVLPMGDGNFILPLNAGVRKAIGKSKGDTLKVQIELDPAKPKLSPDLMKCLREEPEALVFFKSMPGSHQHYFSKWIEGAKTEQTKAKRIVMTVMAMSKHQTFPEMLRASRKQELF
jgi:hypothetical protein